jgi:MFS family permease
MAGPAPRRLLALALTSQLTVSIVQWGGGALGPDLMHRYHLSAAGLGALLSAGAVGNALALIVAGGVIDRIGARRPLIAGGLVAGTALAVGGLAAGAWTLGAALLVFGTAGAFVAIAGTVSVFHSFSARPPWPEGAWWPPSSSPAWRPSAACPCRWPSPACSWPCPPCSSGS